MGSFLRIKASLITSTKVLISEEIDHSGTRFFCGSTKAAKLPLSPMKKANRTGERLLRATVALLFACMVNAPFALKANPQGEQVVAGSATFDRSADRLNITTSNQVIINWQDFSVGQNETTQFIQPGSSSVAVNRVVTGNPSAIYGNLIGNGQIILINPNGVMVGSGGKVDTGGFLASTLDMPNGSFFNGQDWRFSGNSEASIINNGQIRARAGDVIMIARQVENHGRLSAPDGVVALGAGVEVLVSRAEDAARRIYVQPSQGQGGSSIWNTGSAEAIQVEFEAAGRNPFALAINNEGVIRATGSVQREGRVFLVSKGGTLQHSGSIYATNKDGSGGYVKLMGKPQNDVSTVLVSGTIEAKGNSLLAGGRVEILGDQIALTKGAAITVSGKNGGTVLVGGDYQGKNPDIYNAQKVFVGEGVTIYANALENGDGGKVIFWADDWTKFYGYVEARGGELAGNGGFVEVSGKRSLSFDGAVDLRAAYGRTGTLLLDPDNIIIANAASSVDDGELSDQQIFFGDGTGTFTISNTALVASLATANTQLQANIKITVNGSVVSTSGFSLTLQAQQIELAAGVSISLGTGTIVIDANTGGTATADNIDAFLMNTGSQLVTSSGNITVASIGSSGIDSRAIRLDGATISSVSGAINLSGTAAGTNGNSHAIQILGGSSITSTGASTIALTGIGNAGGSDGVLSVADANVIGGLSASGNITITTNNYNVTNATLQSSGNLVIKADSAATSIGVAGGVGTLSISTTELGKILDGFASITFGDVVSGTGAVTVNSSTFTDSVTFAGGNMGLAAVNAGSNNLTFQSNAGTVTQSGVLTASMLTLNGTGGTFTLNTQNNNVTNLAGDTGSITFRDDNGFSTGILATTGNITLETTESLMLGGAITSSSGVISLSTSGMGKSLTLSSGADFVMLANTTGTGSISQLNGVATNTDFSGFASINGGDGIDSLTGTTTGQTWVITAADAGTIGGFGFGSFENITGGADVDFFSFAGTGSLSGTLAGGGGSDTLTGNSTANSWLLTGSDAGSLNSVVFSSIENLTGNVLADSFTLSGPGVLSGSIDGGNGADTISYLGSGNPIDVLLSSARAGTVTNLTDSSSFTFSNIEQIDGETGRSNSLTLQNGGVTVTIDQVDGGDTGAGGITFSSFDAITGGDDNDIFIVSNTGTLTGALDGGNGEDTLDYSSNTFAVTVDLDSGGATHHSTTISFSNMEALSGNGTATTLFLTSNDEVVTISSAGAGDVDGTFTFDGVTDLDGNGGVNELVNGTSGGVTYRVNGGDLGEMTGLIDFNDFGTLTGSGSNDSFVLADGGSLSGAIDGAGGSNTLSYVSRTASVAVDLEQESATDIAGGFANIVSFIGSGVAGDSLAGADLVNTWTLTGVGRGTVDSVNFDGFEDLVAGNDEDLFVIGEAADFASITGNGGNTRLDYSGNTLGVTFDLDSGDGTHGSITINTSGVTALSGNGLDTTLILTSSDEIVTLTGSGTGDVDGNLEFDGVTLVDGNGGSDELVNDTGASQVFAIADTDEGSITGILSYTGFGNLRGDGSDTLSYSGYTGGAVTVNLEDLTATALNGEFDGISVFIGSSDSGDTLIGEDAGLAWMINAANGGSAGATTFTFFENLTGGSGTDGFSFTNAGSLSGSLDGGGGTNTLTGDADGNAFTITGVNSGTLTGKITGGWSGIGNLVGGAAVDSFAFGGAGELTALDGAGGSDTLAGDDIARNFSITGINEGTLAGLIGGTWSAIENLAGGSNNDSFVFSNGAALSGTIDGGGGGNNLDYGTYTIAIIVNLQTGSATGTGGFSNIGSFMGGTASDTLTGADPATTWAITSNNSGSAGSVNFSSFENLTGGSGNDSFVFSDGIGVSGTTDGGGGINTLDYSAYSTAVSVNLQSLTATATGGFSNIGSLIGGTVSDTLTGADLTNSWSLTGPGSGSVGGVSFSGFESLVGGSATDNFQFSSPASYTSINGGLGSDTADYSLLAGPFSLIAGDLTMLMGASAFSSIESITGSASTANLVNGQNVDTTWDVTGLNAFTVAGINYNGFENITGGSAADTFNFETAGSLTGSLNGGSGGNTLSYSGRSASVSVNLQTGVATSIGGTFSNIGDFVGGNNTADSLTGADVTQTWTIDGLNSGNIGGTLTFTGFEGLTGGNLNDVFAMVDGGSIGSIAGGGGTTNSLDYSARTGAVSVNFGTGVATGITNFSGINTLLGNAATSLTLNAGNDSVQITTANAGNVNSGQLTYSSVQTLDGAGGSNTLIGRNVANTFAVTGTDSGTVDAVAFSNFGNLTGNAVADQFQFQVGGILTGAIDGAGGTNTLQGDDANRSWIINGNSTGSVSVLVGSFAFIQSLVGGNLADTFIVANSGVMASINGGSGSDALDYSTRTGVVSVSFSGGSGSGTGVTAYSNIGVLTGNTSTSLALNAGNDSVQITAANAGNVNSGQLVYSSVQTLDGVGGINTLIGRNVANTFAVTGMDSGTVDGVAFSNFGNLTGNAAADVFQLQTGGSLSGNINGAAGANTLTYAGRAAAVNVNLQSVVATDIAGSFSAIGEFVGGSNTGDSLTGVNAVQTWTINGVGSGNIGGTVTFASFENVNGGSQADTFTFSGIGSLAGSLNAGAGNDLINLGAAGVTGGNVDMGDDDDTLNMGSGGSITGTLTGGNGTDNISYAGRSSLVTVNLALASATDILLGAASGFTSIENITGGSNAADQLTGANVIGQSWVINGTNTGTVGGMAFSFSSFENLTGGTQTDSFTFSGAGALSGNLSDLNSETTLSGAVVAARIQLVNVLLASNVVLNTSAANGMIQVSAVNGNGFSLGFSSGTGTKTISGAVTLLSAAAGPALSLQGIGLTTFSSSVISTVGGIDGSGAGNVNFGGNVTLGDGSTGSNFAGLVTFTAAGGTAFSGFDGLILNGGLSLGGNSSITSNGSTLLMTALDGNANSLILNAGTGILTISGAAIDLSSMTATATTSNLQIVTTSGNQSYTGSVIGTGLLTADNLTLQGVGNVSAGGLTRLQTSVNSLLLGKSSGNAFIQEVNGITLSGINVGADVEFLDLLVSAGDMTQTGSLDLTGDAVLTTSGGSIRQSVGVLNSINATLVSAGGIGTLLEAFDTSTTGLVTLATSGIGAAGDINLVEANALSTSASRLLVTTDASKQSVRLIAGGASFAITQSFGNTTDDLLLSAVNGSIVITNPAAVVSADVLALQSGGANGDIGTLTNPLRINAGTVQFTATGNGQVQIREANMVTITGSSVSGNIRIISSDTLTVGGNISTTGSISLETLDNNIEGVTVGTPTITANFLNMEAPGSIIFNNLIINAASGVSFSNLAALGNLTVGGNFTMTAGGSISQIAGTSVNVGGLFTVNAVGQSVVLDRAGNQFGLVRINAASLVLNESNSTLLDQIQVAGLLDITSAGSISQVALAAIRASSLRLSSGGTILLNNFTNEVAVLGDVARGGFFQFFNSTALVITGLMNTGDITSEIEIVTQSNMTIQNGTQIRVDGGTSELILASRSGQFLNQSVTNPLLLGAANRFLIYSGTEALTTLGSISATYTQFGSPYAQPGLGSGNGLLLREILGVGPVVVLNPSNPVGGSVNTNVGDFGLRSIELDINASRLGRFGAGGFERLSVIGANGEGSLGGLSLEDIMKVLEKDISKEARDELMAAWQSMQGEGFDPRESILPAGLVYLQDSKGRAVVILPSQLMDSLAPLLNDQERARLSSLLAGLGQP